MDVTVVLLDDGLTSTAIMPVEIFHSAGALWNDLSGQPAEPAFRVTTVSLDGGPVRSPYGLGITPQGALADVARTDIVIVPTSGMAVDETLAQNAALLPWLRRQHAGGAYVAGICMGAAYLAEDEAAVHEHARLSGFPANRVTEVVGMIDPTTAG